LGLFDNIKNRQLKSSIEQKGLALALGGGGLKVFFHIGVIEALEIAGIKIMEIAGTSAGSVIGAAYAAGLSVDEIKEIGLEIDKSAIFEYGSPSLSKNGLLKGIKAQEYFDDILNHINFDDLKIPFYAIATDLISGEEVVIDHGNVALAIRASISIPAIFEPVIFENKVLVDGGVVNNLPVSVIKKHWRGAVLASQLDVIYVPTDIVIRKSSNILNSLIKNIPMFEIFPIFKKKDDTKYLDANITSILWRSWAIMSHKKLEYDLKKYPPDILVVIDKDINPGINDLNRYNIQEIIDHGKNTTLQTLNKMGIIS
jgi:NTE family protein